jgi:hypothetical protein
VYLPLPTIGSIVSPFVFISATAGTSYAPAAAKHEPILHREYATTSTCRFGEMAAWAIGY